MRAEDERPVRGADDVLELAAQLLDGGCPVRDLDSLEADAVGVERVREALEPFGARALPVIDVRRKDDEIFVAFAYAGAYRIVDAPVEIGFDPGAGEVHEAEVIEDYRLADAQQ